MCLLSTGASAQEGTVRESLQKIDKWVETRQIISKEQTEWQAEKEYLQDTHDLLAQQVEALQQSIETLEANTSQADSQRNELMTQRAELRNTLSILEERVAGFEKQLKQITQYFPKHLRSNLKPLLVQIPDDPTNTEVGVDTRYLNLLGILGAADKANNAVEIVGESRKGPDGTVRQATTLYWGLGFAWSASPDGESAFYGYPVQGGEWQFDPMPDSAAQARYLLDMAEGNTDSIAFVQLPIALKKVDVSTPPILQQD